MGFGADYAPFTDLEVLTIAGIEDEYVEETLACGGQALDTLEGGLAHAAHRAERLRVGRG